MRFVNAAVSGMVGILTGLAVGYALWGHQTALLTEALAKANGELATTRGWLLDEIEWSDERRPADRRVPALGARVAGQETRLSETEVRLQELEDTVRRRAAEPPPVVAPRVATPPPARRTSGLVKPSVPPRPVATKAVEPPAAEVAAPRAVQPPAPSASPASPSPRTPPPPFITSLAPSPSPAQVPPSSPPVAAAAGSAPLEEAAAPTRPAPRQGFDLRSKLREDWREIRQDSRRAIGLE